jgi:glycosyltransferase involved in cell wall biosynthesis
MINKKILFVTTVDYGSEYGGAKYTRSIVNSLPREWNVEVLILANVQLIKYRTLRWMVSLFKSLYTFIPPNILFHSGLLSNDKLSEILKESWDLIFVDHLESGCILNSLIQREFIYVSQNRESQLVKHKLPKFLHWFGLMLAPWIEKFEINLVKSSLGVITISGFEAQWYRKYCSCVDIVYPIFNVDEEGSVSPRFKSNNVLRLGFLGVGTFHPNREAVNILINHIFPKVNKGINFILAGKGWDDKFMASASEQLASKKNVTISRLGYVSNIRDFWLDIDVFLAPIISGAGVNVKVCEALANNVPLIALPHALRGLPENITFSELVYLANSYSEFSHCIDNYTLSKSSSAYLEEFSSKYAEDILKNMIMKCIKYR